MSITSKIVSACKRYRREASIMTLLVTVVSTLKTQDFSPASLLTLPAVFLASAIFFAAMTPLMEDADKAKKPPESGDKTP